MSVLKNYEWSAINNVWYNYYTLAISTFWKDRSKQIQVNWP